MQPPPPLTALDDLSQQMLSAGWAVLSAASLQALCVPARVAALAHDAQEASQVQKVPEAPDQAWQAWLPLWADLPPDPHLRDGGGYRHRRHGSFTVEDGRFNPAPPRAHWQPVEYNALHGGYERWFDPLPPKLAAAAAWASLMQGLANVADALRGPQRWFGEAHMFRIDTGGPGGIGIGRPTPEGAHRDGVDLVAVMLVGRSNVKGGETRVFDARGPQGMRFTLAEPFSVLLLDDERVIHETTPIQPADAAEPAWRDTLVVTLRQGSFQGPGAVAA